MIEERAGGWAVVLPYGDLDLVWPGYPTRALAEEVETRNAALLAHPLIAALAYPEQPGLFDEEP